MKTLKNLALSGTMLLSGLLFTTNISAQEQKAPQLTDPEIASVAVTANQIDVEYAEMALKKSNNKTVKNFATTMKNDHNAVIKMAVDLVTKLKVTPKTNAVTKSLLDGAAKEKAILNAKSGKAFDKAYVDNEVAYHESTIKAVESILIPQSKNAELKALLVKAVPIFKTHLEHAKMIQKELK
ncbi:DUF4142 domain-containing protein [Kaistella sp.]|uniref:DUF4142 domain-containing protein n=1 Tax=Kaistella sp. TaxID=2782235 RepID=UPI003C68F432